jgi:hypothetical protein
MTPPAGELTRGKRDKTRVLSKVERGVLAVSGQTEHQPSTGGQGAVGGEIREPEVSCSPPLTGAGAAGESPGHRNAPAHRAGNDIASLPDEAGRVGENGEILFGEIEVAIFHARGQRRRELDVCADADTPAGL